MVVGRASEESAALPPGIPLEEIANYLEMLDFSTQLIRLSEDNCSSVFSGGLKDRLKRDF